MPAIIRILVENGANVNQRTVTGHAPLYYAISKASSKEAIATLIELGAIIDEEGEFVYDLPCCGSNVFLFLVVGVAASTKRQSIVDMVTAKLDEKKKGIHFAFDVCNLQLIPLNSRTASCDA